jgi:tripartite-type tricarboxylate transporter receptor subunit TctC
MPRRQILHAGLAVAASAAAPAGFAQAAFPSRPIKFIVPFPPGGATDLVGRLLAAKLQESWGQNVVVENKAGASGMIGTEQVARAAPDGHTVLVAITTHVQNPAIFAKVPYDPLKDFAPVSQICLSYLVLVVKPEFPARDLKEFVALVKATPGKYSFGSFGTGSSSPWAGWASCWRRAPRRPSSTNTRPRWCGWSSCPRCVPACTSRR